MIRSKVRIEEMENGKKRIIVYEIPYQVNKATLIEKIASLVREKVIDGITYLNDESNRDGVRIVIELRKDVQEDVILNQLYRLTPLQTSFGINMLALHKDKPVLMGIKEMLAALCGPSGRSDDPSDAFRSEESGRSCTYPGRIPHCARSHRCDHRADPFLSKR